MKYFILSILFLITSSVKAQLAVIADQDGYVNVRQTGNMKAQIIGKINSGEIVLYNDDYKINEWKEIYYSPNQVMTFPPVDYIKQTDYLEGFVHKSRVIPIGNSPRMILKKGVGYITANKPTDRNDTIVFILNVKKFNINFHKIIKSDDGCTNCKKKFVDKIDGRKPWGIDGDLPEKEIYNIALTINKKTILMPVESYNDLFEPNSNTEIHYDDKGNIYLYMPNNSDGAGGYDVVWVIRDGKLTKRYVDSID